MKPVSESYNKYIYIYIFNPYIPSVTFHCRWKADIMSYEH